MNSVIACHIDIGNDKLKQLGNALLPSLPRNPSGKVLKRTLRELDTCNPLSAQEGE
jgi:acyl-CoA synthetase (AMP-forming)/AMP-acid ligase II